MVLVIKLYFHEVERLVKSDSAKTSTYHTSRSQMLLKIGVHRKTPVLESPFNKVFIKIIKCTTPKLLQSSLLQSTTINFLW